MMHLVQRYVIVLFAFGLGACQPTPVSTSQPVSTQAVTPQKFQSIDIAPGDGPVVADGATAVVHYTGWLFDNSAPNHQGRKFDSSRDHGSPFRFRVGAGRVIKGWDIGVAGMKVGGQRRLIVPPEMGYGAEGAGGGLIPPNATLLFDVELLAIE